MLRLPYGISNFEKVACEDYYFVDRTPYIARLEQLPERYLFLAQFGQQGAKRAAKREESKAFPR
jgi:hypothetical protein